MTDILTQKPYNMDVGTAQWLASSYDSQSVDFGFDNDLVTRLKPEFSNQNFIGMVRNILEDGEAHVHLVRGGKNKEWLSGDILSELEDLKKEFPSTFHIHVLPKAGHNVHVDDLHGLVALFKDT